MPPLPMLALHSLGQIEADRPIRTLLAEAGRDRQPMASALADARTLLERNGASSSDVGSVVVYLADQGYRAHINEPWLELFPNEGDRPARRTTRCDMPPGQLVQLQLTAVPGVRRRELALPG